MSVFRCAALEAGERCGIAEDYFLQGLLAELDAVGGTGGVP